MSTFKKLGLKAVRKGQGWVISSDEHGSTEYTGNKGVCVLQFLREHCTFKGREWTKAK